jgi:Predicted NTPase (NACHT family)
MMLTPPPIKHYHIFLASPGDVNDERQIVRQFFERYNRTIAQVWSVRFEVVDWENYASIGVGRPQELITKQTLERFKDSLILVIGIMAQRFGSPTGEAESGTEEEYRWALAQQREHGFPEIKWFFKRIERFVAPPDPEAIAEAAAQWQKVRDFREELKTLPMYFAEYSDAGGFKETFENDLSRWLADRTKPWIAHAPQRELHPLPGLAVPDNYYETLERDFHRLDISGIDNDKSFEIPLSEIYVRLRVMFDEELQNDPSQATDAEAIDIQTALLRYSKLVIVGDPGSGKSTFLKYVALMLARSVLQNNPAIALEKLCIQEPLPIPIFVSCWDFSDFLRERGDVRLTSLLDFLAERMTKHGFQIEISALESLLNDGSCCLLFDGLDEVPTDAGRTVVSRLLEDCVKKYHKNRYVVTSRVRAYTGDTILKGEFARCDIQPFDVNDRAQFLKNWVALLFRISPESVLAEGTDANREFQSLAQGIEANDRIRPLAVNPLLLTVIAIVHWNRKRLPEQRVDLYDECVDVLLGQRKEAEHIQSRRKADAFDEQAERQQEEERPWLRKRFAEIALRILEGEASREEASKSDVIKLLAPRFLDRGARTQEEAEIRAERFLEKQELRSGLLVSRRAHSYRFVHLTFQEYLAAWHLSNQEFDQVTSLIEPRLRQQKWFEPLQLLGGEWAKQSDEKLDRYLQWLLERQGESIIERAPVVALCANIVKDTSGVAELTPETRKRFQSAVEDTLDAFRPKSNIALLTQLEILEALGQLGAAVKSHLIDATKSGLNQVRSRAIEILLPHLSDDELFDMGHLLNDRSKEPIKTYLLCLLGRDSLRTAHWLIQQEQFPGKATDGFTDILYEFKQKLPANLLRETVTSVFTKGASYSHNEYFYKDYWPSRAKLIPYLNEEVSLRTLATSDNEPGVRARIINEIIARKRTDPQTWEFIRDFLTNEARFYVSNYVLDLLAENQPEDPQTWELICESVTSNSNRYVRAYALDLLIRWRRKNRQTWHLLAKAAITSDDFYIRRRSFVEIILHRLVNRETKRLFPHVHHWEQLDFDPAEPITHEWTKRTAIRLNLSEGEVHRLCEKLAEKFLADFNVELKLEWREKRRD